MKKFLSKIVLFIFCVVLLDLIYGALFSTLRSNAKGGITHKIEYIANASKDDIIVLGSSRAVHHYNPQILEDSLGLTCYNCGEKGNGIVLAYARFKMITQRHKPKLILYEVTPDFDYGVGADNRKYLSYLRPYYSNKEIRNIFNDFDDDLSWLKMQSRAYQNTSKIVHNIADNIIPTDNKSGFMPLEGSITKDYVITNSQSAPKIEVDSLKYAYVEKLIVESKEMGIPIIFLSSPLYKCNQYSNPGPVYDYEPAKKLCIYYNIPYWDMFMEPTIINNPLYWHDGGHMNSVGANAFTKLIVNRIRQLNII